VSGTPHPPACGEVEQLRARVAELEAVNARLREALAAREELAAAELAVRDAQLAVLAAQVEELRRRLGKESSTSSRPPSSDGPYRKPRDRSLRKKTGRRPGKQPGAQSSTLRQCENPDEIIGCPPPACGCCGMDLAGVPVLAVQKLQVAEVASPPPPRVTEYQVPPVRGGHPRDRAGGGDRPGAVRAGRARQGGAGQLRALPAGRPRRQAGRRADRGAGICRVRRRGAREGRRAAGAVHGPGPRAAPLVTVLYADETPARAAGGLHYVHVACTEFLTAMHTGDRTKQAIDAWRAAGGPPKAEPAADAGPAAPQAPRLI